MLHDSGMKCDITAQYFKSEKMCIKKKTILRSYGVCDILLKRCVEWVSGLWNLKAIQTLRRDGNQS